MTDNHRNKTNDENKKASWLQFIERRLLGTFKNSLAGLSIAFKSEEAFRVEALLMAIALPAIYWVAESVMESLLLLIVTALILITELINSAVEATVDRVGMDYHELSKKAKDIGSAAVLISLLLAAVTWGVLIFT
jgi:diacylglycerol kinase (ATP)